VVCAASPDELRAVGLWYDDFAQTDDDEVRELLAAAARDRAGPSPPAPTDPTGVLARAIADTAIPLTGSAADFDALIALVGDARCVLLGEASHGTHDFYRVRAELTKRLIRDHGFTAVAAEADWPDAYRVNRYVRGEGRDQDATDALGDFRRFPQWMWRNADVLDFVGWLRSHNDHIADPARRVGFYGLDLYSLHGSIEAVLAYLDRADPDAARSARDRYACFEHFGADPQRYGYAVTLGLGAGCEDEVIAQLQDLQRRRATLLARDGLVAEDEQFAAEQNARVIARAEEYYRSMYRGRVSSWNLRDTHMADTLDALITHLDRRVARSKIVVWAHNSHVGDARFTELGTAGELTIGQLCRQRYPDTVLVGFSTYQGTVTAATDWGGAAERRQVRPGLPGSYEALFHHTGVPRFLLLLRDLGEAAGGLREARLQRAIGVIYRPDTERVSHYFRSQLPAQFDAIIHLDETRALEPMERTAGWDRGELPETYPSGV
jgi:erythromycin esterase-like protein